MSRQVNFPNGAWPTEMRGQTAAAYCDELGIYPKPCNQYGILPKWHRAKLDEVIALRHGFATADTLLTEDVVGLI